MTTPDPTVFERCARAACRHVEGRDDVWDDLSSADRKEYYAQARAVLTALRDHTPSPRTVDEVTRVLGEGE